jgi:3-hydroxybutyryl-CoA dehydrogenase
MTVKGKIAIVGAGRMGRGIALAFAYAGFEVDLIDIKTRTVEETNRLLKEAKTDIMNQTASLSALGLFSASYSELIASRVHYISKDELPSSVKQASFIFEAVPEVLDIKREAFEMICTHTSPDTIIASTTSTFLVDTLAQYVTSPNRFVNTHWLNPAYLMPLVEISPGHDTSSNTVQSICDLLQKAGKQTVECSSSPGFIVPRLQALVMNEAARLVEEGVATPEHIDRASRLGFGIRFAVLGLLEFIDWGGGDILYYASNYLKDSLQAERYTPPDVITSNMQSGKIGMKAGHGFYDFSDTNLTEYQQETMKKFIDLLQHLDLISPPGEVEMLK